jgi:O-antigen/teichoic acid export membrane protein
MIHSLGAARYGVWMLILEVTGYYAYFDLGVRAALTYYTALHLAEGKQRDFDETASTAIWSLSAIGIALSLTGFLLAGLFPLAFDLSGIDPAEAWRAIVIMAVAIGVSLPGDAMSSILNGARRLDVANAIDMIGVTAATLSMLVCVLSGKGLIALALIQLAAKGLVLVGKYFAIRGLLPALSLSPGFWRPDALRHLARFGVPSLLINLGLLASSRTDLIVVGMFAGVRMVPLYGIPRALMEYATSGVRSITSAFCAPLTHLHAAPREGDREGAPHGAIELFLQGSRISAIVVFLLTAYIAAFGPAFLRIWQGAAFVSGPWQMRADVVLLILVLAFLPRLLQSMSTQFLYAINRLHFLVRMQALEAGVKIALSFALAPNWGLAGVAIANLIPIFLFQGIAVTVWLFRSFPLPPRRYIVEAIGQPLAVGAVAWLVSFSLVRWRDPANWFTFIAEAALASAAGIAAAGAFALSRAELRTVRNWFGPRAAVVVTPD